MVRSLRIEYPGALYHITSRGNKKENIYLSDNDRVLFLDIFSKVSLKCSWVCYAYCLMSNHYHFLIETPLGNLSKGMQLLNGIYTQKFNQTHNRVGHIFQGRFKGILVEKDNYLLELSRYIVLNPVRAQMVFSVGDWPWSSYHSTINPLIKPSWLSTDLILSLFSQNLPIAIEKYQQYVCEGMEVHTLWDNLKNQIYLGSANFVNEMQKKVELEKKFTYIPQPHYMPVKCSLHEYEKKSSNRNDCIRLAYASGQFSLAEIGEYFGLHYSWISRIVNMVHEKAKSKA
ncbi:transposase [Legionella waltersii]|uniref:Transposase IS200 like protein n=1 Tax=Legionella waltersii TaxID=66969 RepID=A0A0W1A1E7_9GAMM|nr:transposase [Legionella waltersii]KTD75196.1 Transposase IS200 like protein [Legionella waltersii]SNV10428.1 Transposase and inactivated derivatives [Legionella waltersii]